LADSPGNDAWTDGGAADGMPEAASFGLGPYSALVLSQDG
jgi:hypothetical protein